MSNLAQIWVFSLAATMLVAYLFGLSFRRPGPGRLVQVLHAVSLGVCGVLALGLAEVQRDMSGTLVALIGILTFLAVCGLFILGLPRPAKPREESTLLSSLLP